MICFTCTHKYTETGVNKKNIQYADTHTHTTHVDTQMQVIPPKELSTERHTHLPLFFEPLGD